MSLSRFSLNWFGRCCAVYLWGCLSVFSCLSWADPRSEVLPVHLQTKIQELSQHSQWLNLLHFQKDSMGVGGQSYVDDKRFFLSEQGRRDPLLELQATLQAFIASPDNTQCRFVARRLWLAEQLPELAVTWSRVSCKEYSQWRETLSTQKVVLVFASSYLNSPSSMYGHTFLRFDPVGIEQGAPLLSYALNFGAVVGAEDNGMLYAYRGLVGGYPGLFSAHPYYEKVKEYSRMDNRDLWEYQLNLNNDEIDRMMAHIWELDKINFQYYFFDENCSFRLMELLDVARPGHRLATKFPLVAIPIDTVRAADDAGMVEKVVYRPSNRTRLLYKINKLSPALQQMALELADDGGIISSPEFTALNDDLQRTVIEVAYSYLRDKHNVGGRDKAVAKRSYQLLQALHKRADSIKALENEKALIAARPLSPELGHKTTLVGVTAGFEGGHHRGDEGGYIDVEGRMAYHDLLDNIEGYPKDTSLNMGRMVIRFKEDQSAQLQRFDVLEITSLSTRNQFFKPLSWQVNAGLERQWTNGKDELVSQVNGGAGWTQSSPWGGRMFTLVKSRVEYNPGFEKNLDIALGFSAGAFWQGSQGSTMVQIESLRFTDDVDRHEVRLEHQLVLDKDAGLRFHVKRSLNDSDGVNEAGISYRHYF
jgi:Domain of unknown function (DUF4105)